jgi:hypothetical protein
MKNELVLIGEEKIRADKILLPDIRWVGVFASRAKHESVCIAHRTAIMVHSIILSRTKATAQKEHFSIDVPNLSFLAKSVPSGIWNEISHFTRMLDSLVRHLLPKARATVYNYKDLPHAGITYEGFGWVAR